MPESQPDKNLFSPFLSLFYPLSFSLSLSLRCTVRAMNKIVLSQSCTRFRRVPRKQTLRMPMRSGIKAWTRDKVRRNKDKTSMEQALADSLADWTLVFPSASPRPHRDLRLKHARNSAYTSARTRRSLLCLRRPTGATSKSKEKKKKRKENIIAP